MDCLQVPENQTASFLPDFDCMLPLHCSGIALKHISEKVFTSENGMRRNVPKVLVVITDGRSQDEVKVNAAKLQQAGKRRHPV